jgi:tyrosine-protein phosphatase YwqE
MFDFFSKKKFLVDQLDHFVDIHNHVLPGIDDGAQNPAEGIALLKGLQELGITRLYPTPHIFPQLYPNSPESIAAAHLELREAMLAEDMTDIYLSPAAEHMIDDSFEEMLEGEGHMPLKSEYLLFEMSFLQPPLNLDRAIISINQKGLTPILAHPERYSFMHKKPENLRRLREQGIQMQLNILSLGGHYDKEVQRLAWKLIEDRQIDYLATDMHNLRHLKALKEIVLPAKRMDQLMPVIQHTIEAFY